MSVRKRLTGSISIACALAAASCRSVTTVAAWPASPFVQVGETCDEQPPRVAPLAGGRKLRIASWNMHYLGPSEQTPDEKRDPRALAEYVRLSGASVLALQEIGVQMRNDRLGSATLDAMFDALRSQGAGDWTYLLYGHPESDTNQFVGLAWDRNALQKVGDVAPLELTGDAPWIVPLVPAPISTDVWLRKPFAVKLTAGPGLTDLVFIPVHLTARTEMFFFEDATAHRGVEAEALAGALGEVKTRFGDDDVVVLGDFNIEFVSEDIGEALVKKGWRDLNCAGLGTYPQLDMPLDRFYVPDDQPEFGLDPNFARVVPPGLKSWSEFVDRYSDHLLIVAEVLVGADDD